MTDDNKNTDTLIKLSPLTEKKQLPLPIDKPWMTGTITTSTGEIPVVKTELEFTDRFGSWKVRWSIGRSKYRVTPGLYAVGSPNEKSPVLVSANYKLSFDSLRSNLAGIDCWILVIDTKGINVWCAAGKGTFGTDEIIFRIGEIRLSQIVSHRKIIVPQLGAPGIAAHTVKDVSGFRIKYGPVRAEDIKDYLANEMKATEKMRTVNFGLWDRLVLVPNDLILSLKYLIYASLVVFVLSGLGEGFFSVNRLIGFGLINVGLLTGIYIFGHLLPPALLPFIPGRSFSAKGGWIGLVIFLAIYYYSESISSFPIKTLELIGWFGLAVSITSFIAMNFTGASTYTSLSGVKKEMKIAVPIQLILFVSGLGFWIAGKFV